MTTSIPNEVVRKEIEAKDLKVLAISYGRDLFMPGHKERERMISCAEAVEAYHMVVFTHRRDGLSATTEGKLTLHPTNSRSRLCMMWDAYRIGRKIVGGEGAEWVVTAQDPFEAGLVGWLVARTRRAAFNIQEHADFFSTPHWRRDQPANRIRYRLGLFLLRRADSVRVVSKRIETTLDRLGIPTARIMRLAVRTDQITESQGGHSWNATLRSRYPDALIVLTLARLVRQKNLPLLIRAFAQLALVSPQALLVIVGKGEEEERLKTLTQELGLKERVLFMPWTDEPQALLRAADIYALSSHWEGWARVLIEAMAAGVPVVTTDVGCAGEVLIDNEHGFVVPVGDEVAFAGRLIELADDEEKQRSFGLRGRLEAEHHHMSVAAYASEWATVLCNTVRLHRSE